MRELKIIDTNKLMDMNEAASILGIKKSTLYQKVMRKQIAHKKPGKLTRFSVADIAGHLINFFRVIQHPEKRQTLIERLNYMPYSRQLWQEIRKNWKQGNISQDEIERVSWWYYLNSTCFGGDFLYGGFEI